MDTAHPRLPRWYPADVEGEIDLSGTESPYGETEPELMALLERQLQPRSRVLDLAGGDGRYALPLARAGMT